MVGFVFKLMHWPIQWNIYISARFGYIRAIFGVDLYLAFDNIKCLLVAHMCMRPGTTIWRNKHIDHRVCAARFFARNQYAVCVAHYRQALPGSRINGGYFAHISSNPLTFKMFLLTQDA